MTTHVTNPAPSAAEVEVLKVWYSVFCTLVDAHLAGETGDFAFLDKLVKLRHKTGRKKIADGSALRGGDVR